MKILHPKRPHDVAEKTEHHQLIAVQCGDSYREVPTVLWEHKKKINAS